jgi:hypothetical protein
MECVTSLGFLLGDGANYVRHELSPVETALGLLVTACAIALFVRALVNGSGPYGRGSVTRR